MIFSYFMNTSQSLKMTGIKHLICAFLFVANAVAQPAATSLQNRMKQLLNDDFFRRATAGIAVYDLTDQKMLYVHNEKRLSRPASNMKLLTSAAALSILTPEYFFKTELYYKGTIDESGQLSGDIFLAGGFDPELKTADLDELILLMKKSGIQSINGNLYLDVSMGDSVHWGKAWSWDDDLEAFQPYLSPIPLNKGTVKLKVIPAMPCSAPIIKTEPESSFIQVTNHATTVLRATEPPAKTLRFSRESNGNNNLIVISGTISASVNAYETMISLKNPRGYILTIFTEKMLEHLPGSNIRIAGTTRVPKDAHNLGCVTHSMAEVVNRLNKESDNLNAEMLLYALGYRQNTDEPASSEKGIAVVRQMIAQIGFESDSYSIVDGSGLSNQNYLTPELLLAVLKHMYQSQNSELFIQSLPIAGVDGTLAHRMKGPATCRKLAAKTGSLTGVSALSGYLTARNGHLLAFSIMIQNFVEKTSFVAVNYIDKICEALAE